MFSAVAMRHLQRWGVSNPVSRMIFLGGLVEYVATAVTTKRVHCKHTHTRETHAVVTHTDRWSGKRACTHSVRQTMNESVIHVTI